MSTHELGPLPAPIFGRFALNEDDGYWYECDAPAGEPAFDADQMHAYARAEVARAVEAERERMNQHAVTLAETARLVEQERCAKLCEKVANTYATPTVFAPEHFAMWCAAAIREGAR